MRRWFHPIQQVKDHWLARQEERLKEEFQPRLEAAAKVYQEQCDLLHRKERELQQQTDRLQDQEQLLADRRLRIAQANEELRSQLRLLEAKAAPDRVWVEAFSRGYEKAWETMWPIVEQGLGHLREAIERRAIDETLQRLEDVIVDRATQLGACQPQATTILLAKQEEFQRKLSQATTGEDRSKYTHYLTALDWMLHADRLHSNESSAK